MDPQNWRHFKDQNTPVIQVQTLPLEGPRSLGTEIYIIVMHLPHFAMKQRGWVVGDAMKTTNKKHQVCPSTWWSWSLQSSLCAGALIGPLQCWKNTTFCRRSKSGHTTKMGKRTSPGDLFISFQQSNRKYSIIVSAFLSKKKNISNISFRRRKCHILLFKFLFQMLTCTIPVSDIALQPRVWSPENYHQDWIYISSNTYPRKLNGESLDFL